MLAVATPIQTNALFPDMTDREALPLHHLDFTGHASKLQLPFSPFQFLIINQVITMVSIPYTHGLLSFIFDIIYSMFWFYKIYFLNKSFELLLTFYGIKLVKAFIWRLHKSVLVRAWGRKLKQNWLAKVLYVLEISWPRMVLGRGRIWPYISAVTIRVIEYYPEW